MGGAYLDSYTMNKNKNPIFSHSPSGWITNEKKYNRLETKISAPSFRKVPTKNWTEIP
jgi:hypothetical protein